jgi:phospho-N-acetylmuramoyl-pentapeptide-transferase
MVNPATLVGFICAFLVSVLPGKNAIRLLKRLNARQNISEDAPASHHQKQGTPTMGGLLILLSLTVTVTAFCLSSQVGEHRHPADDYSLVPVLLLTLAFGGIGFADDFLSARRGKNLGLKAREKLAAQLIAGAGFVFWMYLTAHQELTTSVELIPANLSAAFGSRMLHGSLVVNVGLWYYPLALLFVVGLSNATNFTDGLDGLSTGLAIIMSLALSALVWEMRPDLGFFCIALAGALAGFLWWNAHPANVFMGDTSSLALGAALAAVALLGKQEIGLIIAAAVCWVELISVIVQVSAFKLRRRRHGLEYAQSHRVLRRAPLHHHFEEIGWNETQVVVRFWIVGAICAGLSLLWIRG